MLLVEQARRRAAMSEVLVQLEYFVVEEVEAVVVELQARSATPDQQVVGELYLQEAAAVAAVAALEPRQRGRPLVYMKLVALAEAAARRRPTSAVVALDHLRVFHLCLRQTGVLVWVDYLY